MNKQTCPRRTKEFGPWEHKEHLDKWNDYRWSCKDAKWKWPWNPRSCSFCGSIHPEDALYII